MRVGLVGINHKLADLNTREKLAKIFQRRFGADRSAHLDRSFVLLSTCNRTEIYFSSEDLAETHTFILNILRNDLEEEFDQKLYSFFNEDCFLHLARVSCGLDSAIIFETEIQGQVKMAYEKASLYSKLPMELHYLFQKCLRIGKALRTSMPAIQSNLNLEHAIFSTGQTIFKNIDDPKILFIGASNINLKILHYLKSKKYSSITLCNRTDSTTKFLAQKYSLDTLYWKDLHHWIDFDWIIIGTKSPDYLIKNRYFSNDKIKLVIDLSVPRNIDPSIGKMKNVTLFNIDQMNRILSIGKKKMTHFIKSKELLVSELTNKQLFLFKRKSLQKQEFCVLA